MKIVEIILPNEKAAVDLAAKLKIQSARTVLGWRRRKSIPKEYFWDLERLGIATCRELSQNAAGGRIDIHE